MFVLFTSSIYSVSLALQPLYVCLPNALSNIICRSYHPSSATYLRPIRACFLHVWLQQNVRTTFGSDGVISQLVTTPEACLYSHRKQDIDFLPVVYVPPVVQTKALCTVAIKYAHLKYAAVLFSKDYIIHICTPFFFLQIVKTSPSFARELQTYIQISAAPPVLTEF